MDGADTPFGGRIDQTVSGSTPWWPAEPKAPAGAPNILVVLFDDVGFSDFGCYGSPIKTPTIDKIDSVNLGSLIDYEFTTTNTSFKSESP